MTINSDLVIFPEYRRRPPSRDAVVQVVNHLIVEGMVSVSRPFNVRIGYHRWSRSGGSLASIKETPALDTGHLLRFLNEHSTLLDRSLDLRITFKASSWLFYESVLRRLCILWDEVWPPAIHLDLVPEPTLLWDKLRAGWEVACPDCNQLLYHSRDGVQVGWFRRAPWFPAWEVLEAGRCPDPDSLVQCFKCGRDYAFRDLKVRVPRNSCSEDVPQVMPIYRMAMRVGGGGTWIGVGYRPSETVENPVLAALEQHIGAPLRHFDDWY